MDKYFDTNRSVNSDIRESACKIIWRQSVAKKHSKAGVCKTISMKLHSKGGVCKHIFSRHYVSGHTWLKV